MTLTLFRSIYPSPWPSSPNPFNVHLGKPVPERVPKAVWTERSKSVNPSSSDRLIFLDGMRQNDPTVVCKNQELLNRLDDLSLLWWRWWCMCPYHWLGFCLQIIEMEPWLITRNDALQKTLAFPCVAFEKTFERALTCLVQSRVWKPSVLIHWSSLIRLL